MEIDREKTPLSVFCLGLFNFSSYFSFKFTSSRVCLCSLCLALSCSTFLSAVLPSSPKCPCFRVYAHTCGASLEERCDLLIHPSDSSGIPVGPRLCLAKLLMEVKPLLEKPLRAQQVQKNELPLSLRIKSSAMVQVLLQCHHIRPLFVQSL